MDTSVHLKFRLATAFHGETIGYTTYSQRFGAAHRRGGHPGRLRRQRRGTNPHGLTSALHFLHHPGQWRELGSEWPNYCDIQSDDDVLEPNKHIL
jgi:hypothetical protein